MAIINDNRTINNIIAYIKKYYENTFGENFYNVNIYVSDNINEDTKLFIDIKELPPSDNTTGRYLEPNILSSKATILIKHELFSHQGYPFIATILHELTHASDFKKFNNEYCNGNWLNLKNNPNYKSIYFWSEYHARIISILHMRKVLSILYPERYIYNIDEIRDEMINGQLPHYYNELLKEIDNDNVTLSEIFKYCARLYSCEFYEPNLLIKDYIPELLYEYFPDIIRLYNDLKPLQTYKDASPMFSVFTVTLSEFFSNLSI